jgi:hypothetical protein
MELKPEDAVAQIKSVLSRPWAKESFDEIYGILSSLAPELKPTSLGTIPQFIVKLQIKCQPGDTDLDMSIDLERTIERTGDEHGWAKSDPCHMIATATVFKRPYVPQLATETVEFISPADSSPPSPDGSS